MDLDDILSEVAEKLIVDLAVESFKHLGKAIIEATGSRGRKELELKGSMGYTIDKAESEIEIRAEKIVSNRNGGKSGTLQLELWATDTLYSGGNIRGYVFASYKLDQLEGGYSYNNIRRTVKYEKPPSGSYYVAMTLNEYEGNK